MKNELPSPKEYAETFGKEYDLTIEQVSRLASLFAQCQINTLGDAIKIISNDGEYGFTTTDIVNALQEKMTAIIAAGTGQEL